MTTMKKLISYIGAALLGTAAQAQTVNGPLVLSSPGTTGNYSSNTSVTLSAGFTTTGPFSATIQSYDCLTLTTAPTLPANYVLTNTPRIAGFTDEGQLTGFTACQLMQVIQYADGLGRPIQTIRVMGSPFGNDLVQPQAYDAYGREVFKYLPYAETSGTPGTFRSSAIGSQSAFYTAPPEGVTTISTPYAQTVFDNSPLERPTEQGAPGTAWQPGAHTVRLDYASNNNIPFATDSVNSRQVALYTTTINTAGGQTLTGAGNTATYAPGTLTITITKDENWVSGRAGTTEEYKDIDGRVVLKRVYNYNGALQQLSTYYVYDDLGRLAFVLPPGASPDVNAIIPATTLNNYGYQYQYDGLGRMSQKRLPGKGWEYLVYNNMDQVVATQDSLQRVQNQWIYNKYDGQGRVAATGIYAAAVSRTSLQSTISALSGSYFETATTTGTGYTNVAWPSSSTTALTYNYYDSYSNAPGLPAQYAAPAGADLGTRGQLVAAKTAVLNTPADLLWSAHYYDYFGRSLTAYQQHYLGGVVNAGNYDVVSSTYDFSNAPTTTTRKHWNTASATTPLVTIANTYLYDHMGRKLKSWEQITNGMTATTKTLLSKLDYNETGQLKTKNLHATTDSTTFLQPVSYAYNERGWLSGSTAGLFQLSLLYNTGTHPQYNGNIANQLWGTRATPNANSYTYAYDRLNRLTAGVSNTGYQERGITYDPMGNISTLNRYQAGTGIDSLAYLYTGNALATVTDRSGSNTGLVAATTTYQFDGNGNQGSNTNTTNSSQNKSYTYNLLNLPKIVTIAAGTSTFTYDATGNKLRKVSVLSGTTTTTDCIGGIQYKNGALDFIQTEEGKAIPIAGGYDYEYYLGDNLGNTRVTFGTKTGVAVAYQSDDYYPFGLEINNSVTSPKNEYLYNGKEQQPELGTYDYGFRQYDPVIARWNVPDPDAENYESTSSYAYVLNNPINLGDVDGRDTVRHLKEVFIHDTKPAPKPEPIEVEPLKEIKPIEYGVFIKPRVFLMPFLTFVFVLMPANYDDHEEADNLRFMNARRDRKHPGSYTIKFKSGKRYHGKGSFARALQSAKFQADLHKDSFEIFDIDWTPSTSNEQSFRDEAKRLEADGGKNNPNNYNQIDSPGSHKYKQDQ